jgi:hypothetical protein
MPQRMSVTPPAIHQDGPRRELTVVSAAKSHVVFGLTLKEVREAERRPESQPERSDGKDWEW